MGSETRVKFNSQKFWIAESFLEVLSDYICETFENIGVNTLSSNLQDIYDDCEGNRSGASIGMVNISFDRYITNDEDKATIADILTQTKALILSKGEELSIETLNQFEERKVDGYFKSPWHYPIKTKSLATTIDMIIQLLNGTLVNDNHMLYYSGFPKPSNQPEI